MSIYPKRKAEMIQVAGGQVRAKMEGMERIYSREDSKKMITMAMKASTPKELVALGKFACAATKKQDTRKPEYVAQ